MPDRKHIRSIHATLILLLFNYMFITTYSQSHPMSIGHVYLHALLVLMVTEKQINWSAYLLKCWIISPLDFNLCRWPRIRFCYASFNADWILASYLLHCTTATCVTPPPIISFLIVTWKRMVKEIRERLENMVRRILSFRNQNLKRNELENVFSNSRPWVLSCHTFYCAAISLSFLA